MTTLTDKINQDNIDLDTLQKYADIIKSGKLVAFPTETVYGLGANALDAEAVKKIFAVKNRPANNPLIVHISDASMLSDIISDAPDFVMPLLKSFWPGALTVIFKKADVIPDVVTAGGDTVAVRCPSHPIANALIKLSGVPIVAPSANLSTKPSPTEFEHVRFDLFGKVSGIIDGGSCDIGIESTVVMPNADGSLTVLRPGAITPKMLEQKGYKVSVDKNVLEPVKNNAKVASPGMLYRHYAPKAPMELVRGNNAKNYIKSKLKNYKNPAVLCFDDESGDFDALCIEYGTPSQPLTLSRNLFSALREFDKTDTDYIFARVVEPEGVGLGIYNRMLRAASFNVTFANKKTVLGVTGYSGSGKTTVCEYLSDRGFCHINTDKLVHERVYVNSEVLQNLTSLFGKDVVKDNTVDRKALGAIVFGDKTAYNSLVKMLTPFIVNAVKTEIENCDSELVAVDAPQLFQYELESVCDKTLAVISDNALKNIIERDGIDKNTAKARLNSQKNNQFFIDNCDFVINNSGTKAELFDAANKFLKRI